MQGFLLVFIPFFLVLVSVFPNLFDSTMMSRLAVYPLAGSIILFFGRKNISLTHLITGTAIGLLPVLSLLWGASTIGGLPFAIRWLSFGMMIVGFSGTIAKWGLKSHLYGLIAAAVLVSVLMLLTGANTITGNANRAGMVLSLGFISSLVLFEKKKWYSWLSLITIIAGLYITAFYIGWIAGIAGAFVLFFSKKIKLKPKLKLQSWMILSPMIVGQILLSMYPQIATKIGPSLEIRTRIWRCSTVIAKNNFPLGTGIGSARLQIFNSAEPELRELSGGDKRIDYLHSEPLSLITEMGLPGLLLLLLILYWIVSKCKSAEQVAFVAAFWPIFTSDLPLATPLGAIPSAIFFAMIPSFKKKKISIPTIFPALTIVLSLYWCFTVVTGYFALGSSENQSVANLEMASKRIPWEERVFLAAGHAHLQEGMILSALNDSERFLDLYPGYFRGWELRATALSAAGRESYSAWAKATLLIPNNIFFPDKYLFALNAIQPTGMNADTAVAISIVLTLSKEQIAYLTENLNASEIFLASNKLMHLSEQCKPASMYHAGRTWFMAAGLAIDTGEPIPQELAVRILRERELFPYLESDWKPKANMYLETLMNSLGIEPI